jgi:hypothetical protein
MGLRFPQLLFVDKFKKFAFANSLNVKYFNIFNCLYYDMLGYEIFIFLINIISTI